MPPKNSDFQWTREDQEDALDGVEEGPERITSAEHWEQRADIQDLSARLLALSPGARALLGLDPVVEEAIEVYLRQGPKSSRRRQLLRVQTLLRGEDTAAIQQALDADLQGHGARQWLQELLQGDDAGLMAFCEDHPGADRQQLRSLLRGARKEGKAGERPRAKLLAVLKTLD